MPPKKKAAAAKPGAPVKAGKAKAIAAAASSKTAARTAAAKKVVKSKAPPAKVAAAKKQASRASTTAAKKVATAAATAAAAKKKPQQQQKPKAAPARAGVQKGKASAAAPKRSSSSSTRRTVSTAKSKAPARKRQRSPTPSDAESSSSSDSRDSSPVESKAAARRKSEPAIHATAARESDGDSSERNSGTSTSSISSSGSSGSSVTALASSLFPKLAEGTGGSKDSKGVEATARPTTPPPLEEVHAEGGVERSESPTMSLNKPGPAFSSPSSQTPIPAREATAATGDTATPPRRRRGSHDGEEEVEDRDDETEKGGSPEALTASSEGRRSSTLWQQRLLSVTPAGTQLGNESVNDTPSAFDSARTVDTTRVGGHEKDGDEEEGQVAEEQDKAHLSAPAPTGTVRGDGQEGVMKSLFGPSARAISCDTVLFIDEDGSATPPTAPSSQFLSIPDASTTQTQRAAAAGPFMPPRQLTIPPTGSSSAFTTTVTATAAGRQPSPPLAPSRVSATPTPSQSPGTHLRMSTPSRQRSPAASVATRANSAASLSLPAPTSGNAGRGGFPAAPEQPQPQPQPSASSSTVPSTNATQPLSGVSAAPTSSHTVTTTHHHHDDGGHTSHATPVPRGVPSLPPQPFSGAPKTMDLTSPSRGRLSTQLITRAAVARPLASPGTMWICLDDEDDADVAEPTSPTSPTLKDVRIEAASANVNAKTDTAGELVHVRPYGQDMTHSGRNSTSGLAELAKVKQEEEKNDDNVGEASNGATQQLFDSESDFARRSRKIFELGTRGTQTTEAHKEVGRYDGEPTEGEGSLQDSPPARQQQQQQQQQPHAPVQATAAAATVAPEKGTIGQILSPTFRPRRAALPPLPASAFIRMDDSDSPHSSRASSGVREGTRNEEEEDDDDDDDRSGRITLRPRMTSSSFSSSAHHSHPDDRSPTRAPGPSRLRPPPLVGPAGRESLANASFTSAATMAYVEHDDSDDDESDARRGNENENEDEEGSGNRSSSDSEDIPLARLSHPSSPDKPLGRGTTGAVSFRAPSSTSRQTLILDDDDESDEGEHKDEEEDGRGRRVNGKGKKRGGASDRTRAGKPSAKQTKRTARDHNDNEEEEQPASPVKSVRDFIFPDRNGARSPLFPFSNDDTLGGLFPSGKDKKGDGRTDTAAAKAAKSTAAGGSKKSRGSGDGSGRPNAHSRPVDQLWQFFPSRFTKKSFNDAARRIIPAEHFLEKGQFWDAFRSAEFVGEGSFGLVWRCTTVDGDLVAVKSCPVSLAAKANIEDAFSTLREIAVMRFLNEMQVPYVLPLHSAFTVSEQEALPPLAAEALAWRRQRRRAAEAAVLERQVQQLSASGHVGRKQTSTTAAADAVHSKDGGLAAEIEKQLAAMEAVEDEEEKEQRVRLGGVRLPRFLSISEEDVLQCDATVMLVFELCDGDLESIPRADGVAKGVAYCVSSALAAMHELGLLHLDLKPSNILFAYEHGPSQQTPRASAMLAAADSTNGATAGGGSTHPNAIATASHVSNSSNTNRAVKFYLSDFGNCRIVGPRPDDLVEDAFGTFEYMDLRALRDATCDRATDNFSLGCSLYEMLFGQRVYPKCTNEKCRDDEDHTRECFVEAAARPVVLPVSAATAAAAAAVAAAGDAERADANSGAISGSDGGASAKHDAQKIPLTTLQKLVAALLRPDHEQRMTAAQCRDHLVKVYNITQADGPASGESL